MIKRLFFPLIILLGSVSVHAEQITIGVSKQAAENQNIERPSKGMTKQEVLAQFGQAESQTEARGNPPISSWHYTKFVVYFESDTVIHSVLKHQPKVSQPDQ